MTRYRAAGIHLLASLFIALSFISLVFFLWYPEPYFQAGGGQTLLTLLISIDVSIGPLITLIIFKSGKKGLKFDLSVIFFLQLSALAYGATAILEARPVFVTFAVDRFTLVSAKDITDAALQEAKGSEYAYRSWTGPRLVAAVLPTDPIQRSRALENAITGKGDIDLHPVYYRDYYSQADAIKNKGASLDRLNLNPEAQADIDHFLREQGLQKDSVIWFPLVAGRGSLTMLVNKHSAEPLKAFNVDPWEKRAPRKSGP